MGGLIIHTNGATDATFMTNDAIVLVDPPQDVLFRSVSSIIFPAIFSGFIS
jgi:hypothetical protein